MKKNNSKGKRIPGKGRPGKLTGHRVDGAEAAKLFGCRGLIFIGRPTTFGELGNQAKMRNEQNSGDKR